MLWVLLFSALALFIYIKFWKPLGYWEKEGIRYIKPWPVVGNMMSFLFAQTSFFDFMKNLYNAFDSRYFGVWIFSQPILIIRDAEIVKQICIKDFDNFIDHRNFFVETNEPVFSQNVLAARGQRWRELRAILSPVFTGSKMRAMYSLMSECTLRTTSYLAKETKNQPIEVEMKDFFRRCTIDIIATCAYGIESNSFEDRENEFFQKTKDVGNFTGWKGLTLTGYMIWPALMRALKIHFFSDKENEFFQQIVSNTIAYREKNNIVRPDLLHIMMEARKGQLKFEDPEKYSNAGFATIEESAIGKDTQVKLEITDELIVAQALIFFIGGSDTTSALLSFASYELALNTDVQEKLQQEIDTVHHECSGKITYEAITKMKYMDMVISEALRKWPPGFVMDRYCNKDFKIEPTEPGEKPYVIKEGINVWIPVVGIHKDPNIYSDPERFDPERFNDENKNSINPYAYLPFGSGPRSCIGNRFALLVAKTLLYYILQDFSFVVSKKTDIPLKLTKAQILMIAENGIWLKLQKRAK